VVTRWLGQLRSRLTSRTIRRTAIFCIFLSAISWGVSYYRDWFLYYLQRNTVVRNLDVFTAALRQTRLPMQAAGTLNDGDKNVPL
jgi:hypothetical protein